MNIYEKLQEVKCKLVKMNLKKSGNNKFVGFKYYELQDIMPAINDQLRELKLTSVMRFDHELATLEIINTEKPDEKIQFTMPTSSANLKGCHEVQNLGAVVTYTRRYLWLTALDITEGDVLDGGLGQDDEPDKTPHKKSTPKKKPDNVVLEQALKYKIKSGKLEGRTLEECTKTEDGLKMLNWLATESNSKIMNKMASLVLENMGDEPDERLPWEDE